MFDSVAAVMTIMCFRQCFAGFSAGGFIVNHADIGPKYTGRLMGITNSVAAIPGLDWRYLTGDLILGPANSWSMVFYVTAGVTFFGGIFYLLLQTQKNNLIKEDLIYEYSNPKELNESRHLSLKT